MTLVAPSKKKPSAQARKRQAGHHRHSKSYVNTYWPYLPILAVIGSGVLINRLWSQSSLPDATTALGVNPALGGGRPLTRIEVLTNDQTTKSLLVIIVVTALAAAILTFRHWLKVHRKISNKKQPKKQSKKRSSALANPWLDIAIVTICVIGVLLTRSA